LERKREIREVVLELLDSPLDLPDRFRGWIPRLVESSGIQVPFSQVVGNYVSADSVAGLGGAIHGRRGMVRAGPSDFNFVELVYDAVEGKWVSAPVVVINQNNAIDLITGTTSYDDSAESAGTLLPWGEWTDAGLTMLFRFLTQIRTSHSAATASATLRFQPFTVNGGAGTRVDSTDHLLTTTGSSVFVMRDSGWKSIPGSVSADDFLFVDVAQKIDNAARACSILGATVWMRWVSA